MTYLNNSIPELLEEIDRLRFELERIKSDFYAADQMLWKKIDEMREQTQTKP